MINIPLPSLQIAIASYPGLTTQEVQTREEQGQINQVSLRSSRTYGAIFKDNVFTIFNICLGSVLALLFVLGRGTDASFAGISVVTNIVVGVVQEVRAKRTLDQLALLAVQDVAVIRDAQVVNLPVTQLVKDDVILLQSGDKAPVDGVCLWSDLWELDESLLTGEADSIAKQSGDQILSGSFCLSGQGLFQAQTIGNETYAATITDSSRQYRQVLTPLQRQIDVIVELFLIGLIFASFLHAVASINLSRNLGETLSLLTVIINSFVPAGLIIAISVSFAVGAVRIGRANTLIQRINAVDSMNSVDVLCLDKTGTLTKNQLAVKELIPLGENNLEQLTVWAATYGQLTSTQNSTAAAIARFTQQEKLHQSKQAEVPFNSAWKWGAILPDKGPGIIVGSPEVVLQRQEHIDQAQSLAQQGLRIIGLARCAPFDPQQRQLPRDRRDGGLIILQDEVRPEAPGAIAQLMGHGIETKIISGDSLDTVTAIAHQVGLNPSDRTIFSQQDLEQLDDKEFHRAAMYGQVFGRIQPETKQRLIASLVKQGAYVAMVGDGVNDVMALKQAQLAISMNHGSQITKDIADMVLLNNSLATLVKAFDAGAEIKQKILVSTKLFLTKNLMVIVAILLVGFVQLPFPIQPRQLSVLTFPAVTAPTILIALGLFHPRKINSFTRNVLGSSLLMGMLGGIAITIGFIFNYSVNVGLKTMLASTGIDYWEVGRPQAQGIAVIIGLIFTLLVFWDSCHISIWKPWSFQRSRPATVVGLITTCGAIALLLSLPTLFEIERPDGLSWLFAIVLPFFAHYSLRVVQCHPYFRYLLKLFEK